VTFPLISSDYSELLTFQDAVERVLTTVGARGGHPGEMASARNAVIDAMRELPGRFGWSYYRRSLQLTTIAPVYGNNATYTHTGGDVERQLSLSSGTWPSNAASGQVVLLNNLFRVDKRVDGTTLQLAETSNPGRDLPAQDTTLVYTAYPLSTRVRRLLYLAESQTNLYIDYASHQDLLQFQHINPVPSTPVMFNLHQSGTRMNQMEIEFAPPPLDQRTYSLSIDSQPRQLRTHEASFTTSTVGSTVTATVGTFKDIHVGSVIRFSENTTAPTGIAGTSDGHNPYVDQRIIVAKSSSTVVTMDSALSSDLTGVAAVVTDPLDVDHNNLLNLLLAMAARKFCQYSPNSGRLEEFMAMESAAFGQAIANNDYVHTDLLTKPSVLGIPDMEFILQFPN
jgi:hypothetical protein